MGTGKDLEKFPPQIQEDKTMSRCKMLLALQVPLALFLNHARKDSSYNSNSIQFALVIKLLSGLIQSQKEQEAAEAG